jgi:plastocyanin
VSRGTGLAVAVTVTAAVAGCGGSGGIPTTGTVSTPATPAPSSIVEVRDNNFSPQVVTVAPGSTVEWHWGGGSPHDVTGDTFSSPIQTAGVYLHSFPQAGVYAYRCTVHEHMFGEVQVR